MNEEITKVIIWLAVLLVIVALFALLMRDSKRARERSVEEFERDVEENRGSLLSAGVAGLEKAIGDHKRAAIEYRQDEQRGMTRIGGGKDDADRTEVEGER